VARFSLLPRDRTFFDLFIEAGQNSVHAARLLDQMMNTWPDAGSLSREILKAEQEGDRITHEIVKRLNSTFVTPIDREDIYGLATQMDDIVDFTEEAADYLGLYKIEAPMEQAGALTKVLQATRQIAEAMPRLRRSRRSRTTRSRSTASRTTAIACTGTRWPPCSPTGSTRWS
jgi:predicted phosphate transport protein (TIGR00153 family)